MPPWSSVGEHEQANEEEEDLDLDLELGDRTLCAPPSLPKTMDRRGKAGPHKQQRKIMAPESDREEDGRNLSEILALFQHHISTKAARSDRQCHARYQEDVQRLLQQHHAALRTSQGEARQAGKQFVRSLAHGLAEQEATGAGARRALQARLVQARAQWTALEDFRQGARAARTAFQEQVQQTLPQQEATALARVREKRAARVVKVRAKSHLMLEEAFAGKQVKRALQALLQG